MFSVKGSKVDIKDLNNDGYYEILVKNKKDDVWDLTIYSRSGTGFTSDNVFNRNKKIVSSGPKSRNNVHMGKTQKNLKIMRNGRELTPEEIKEYDKGLRDYVNTLGSDDNGNPLHRITDGYVIGRDTMLVLNILDNDDIFAVSNLIITTDESRYGGQKYNVIYKQDDLRANSIGAKDATGDGIPEFFVHSIDSPRHGTPHFTIIGKVGYTQKEYKVLFDHSGYYRLNGDELSVMNFDGDCMVCYPTIGTEEKYEWSYTEFRLKKKIIKPVIYRSKVVDIGDYWIQLKGYSKDEICCIAGNNEYEIRNDGIFLGSISDKLEFDHGTKIYGDIKLGSNVEVTIDGNFLTSIKDVR